MPPLRPPAGAATGAKGLVALQAADPAAWRVEGMGRQHPHRLQVADLAASLRVAIGPDHSLPFRHPRSWPWRCWKRLAWPACTAGSDMVHRPAKVSGLWPGAVRLTRPASTVMRTVWFAVCFTACFNLGLRGRRRPANTGSGCGPTAWCRASLRSRQFLRCIDAFKPQHKKFGLGWAGLGEGHRDAAGRGRLHHQQAERREDLEASKPCVATATTCRRDAARSTMAASGR